MRVKGCTNSLHFSSLKWVSKCFVFWQAVNACLLVWSLNQSSTNLKLDQASGGMARLGTAQFSTANSHTEGLAVCGLYRCICTELTAFLRYQKGPQAAVECCSFCSDINYCVLICVSFVNKLYVNDNCRQKQFLIRKQGFTFFSLLLPSLSKSSILWKVLLFLHDTLHQLVSNEADWYLMP